jgi:hypothetical protein
VSTAPDDVSGLNVAFGVEPRSIELEYVHCDGVKLLATDEDRSKHSVVYRAFKMGLQPENVPHGVRFTKEKLTKDVETVTIKIPGSSDILKADVDDTIRTKYRQHYDRWKAGKPAGLLLAALSKDERAELEVNDDLIKILASGWVDSVEQLAGLSDQHARGLMGGFALRARAQKFLAKREAEAIPPKVQAALDALSARLAVLEQRTGATP